MDKMLKNPDCLISLGFNRFDNDVYDVTTVIFRSYLFTIVDLNSYLEVEFELTIDDEPIINYVDARRYSFEGVYLRTTDQNLEEDNFYQAYINERIPTTISNLLEIKKIISAAKQINSIS